MLCGLSCLPSLLELHIFGFESEEVWVSLPQLEHLEVLSIGVDTLPNSISRLSNLRELNIHLKIDGFIDDYDIKQLGKSLHSLETLVIVFGKGKVNLGLIPECIEAIPWLQTLVVVAPKVANLNTANVKSSRDGLHKLNVFINEEASHRITVVSANIHVIAIPNTKYGEAIDFLHGYKQNGFVFDNHSCLKMMLRSKQVRGDWDFFKVIEDTEKDEDEISSVAVDTLQGASNCLSAEAKLND